MATATAAGSPLMETMRVISGIKKSLKSWAVFLISGSVSGTKPSCRSKRR